MSGILNTGKLAKLLTWWTEAKSEFLDAAVTSRAAAADYTTTRAAKLDYLDAAISSIQAGLPVPTSLSSPTIKGTQSTESWGCASDGTDSGAVQSTYSTLISDTGEGMLQFIKLYCSESGGSGSDDMQVKLVIDGTTVWESTSSPLAQYNGWNIVGAEEDDETSGGSTGIAMEALRYTTGFSIQVKNNSSTSQYSFQTMYKYYTTD